MSYQPDFLGKMTEKKQDNYILYVCGPEACREIEQVPEIVVRKMYRPGRKIYRSDWKMYELNRKNVQVRPENVPRKDKLSGNRPDL